MPRKWLFRGGLRNAMRQQCVSQIVRVWYDIVTVYKSLESELCISVLDLMRRYISWIEISLVANDVFISLLFDLVLFEGLLEELRGAAAGCVLAVVLKRMDAQAKLRLLKSLQISRVFSLIREEAGMELVSSIATLLTGYAAEILDCSKRLSSEEGKRVSSELLEEKKRIYWYDPIYRDHLDVLDKIGIEEEDRMLEYRKDLLVLLRSVGRVAPDITQLFIRNSLASAVESSFERNVEEVEAALLLLYALGESLSDEAMKTEGGLLGELVPMLLSTRFLCHSNRLVALTYLETITRCMKFVQEKTELIPMALKAFLDERGIYHPTISVSRRASYLFMRVVKLLRAKLVPFIETILQVIMPFLMN